MIHAVKIRPEYYKEIDEGRKNWEIRFNDREYSIGDYIALNEWDGKFYTGRCILAEIVGMGDYEDYVIPGYVILTLKDIRRLDNDARYRNYIAVSDMEC